MEEQQSAWTKSIPVKEQVTIVKRLFKYAKPFRTTFAAAIGFAFVLS